ncbi:MAG: hypothetical protein ACLPYZ_03105 [Limisphaerales bacterium]
MKTMETTEEVSSDGMEKRVERHNWRQIGPCAREKPMADLKKVLANPWSRKKITKKAHAGRGQEAKWEMSNENEIILLLQDTSIADCIKRQGTWY